MNPARPIIGVSSSEIRIPEHLRQLECGEPPHNEVCLGMPYLEALDAVGASPIVIVPLSSETIPSILDTVDAICMSGGQDIDPSAYGQEPHEKLGPTVVATDDFELALVSEADRRKMPILSICRGTQGLNVSRGGTLFQHIPAFFSDSELQHRQSTLGHFTSHDVTVEPGSLLHHTVGTLEKPVNSFHHQAVDELGNNLRVSARAADGVVEAIEATDRDFVVGVQWHVESLTELDEHRVLFEALAVAALRYREQSSGP